MTRRQLTAATLLAAASLPLGLCAGAADLFLKPLSYRMEPGSQGVAAVLNGTIEKSRNAVAWERVSGAALLFGDEPQSLGSDHWTVDGDSARLAYGSGASGTYVLGMSTEPRVVEFTPEQFEVYLKRLGLNGVGDAPPPDVIRERYSKHARAVIQVGDARSDDHRRTLHQPLEIVFDQNPYQLRFGNEISFTVLRDGKPAADLAARAGCEGFHGHDASGNHVSHFDLRTDDDGKATFLLSQKCVWYVSLVSLLPSTSADVDYESHWATATFEVF